MVVEDRIYGEIKIDEPVILELTASPPFQRLKKINQYGGVNFVYPRYQVSRYEHSLGVWHVLRSLGVNREVQVAGLLHDVGHAAFSHMVDQALTSAQEDFHERNLFRVKGRREVDRILEKYCIRLKPIDAYPEVKKPLPGVGADRIDYAIRDFVGATGRKKELGRRVLKSLRLVGRDVVFTSVVLAREYALTGLEAMWLVVYDPKVAVVYQALTEIIREGVTESWLKPADLFGTDEQLLKKMKANAGELDEKYLRVLTRPFSVVPVSPKESYDFCHVKLKPRYFDPLVLVKGQKRNLASMDSEFARILREKKKVFEARRKGQCLKVEFR